LAALNSELHQLGFTVPERNELFKGFLRAVERVELANAPILSPQEVELRDEVARQIVMKLLQKQ
jgi:hypothetical protein